MLKTILFLFTGLFLSYCSSMQQKVCHRDHAYKEGMLLGTSGQNATSQYIDYCEDAPKFGTKSYNKYFKDGYDDGVKFYCAEEQVAKLGKKHIYHYQESKYTFISKLCGKRAAIEYQKNYSEHQKKICHYDYWLSLGKKDALSGIGPGSRVQALSLCLKENRDNFSRAYTNAYDKQKAMMDEASW